MADHHDPTELGVFLKACRSRVQPEELGLISYGGRRRVSGLRREELAQLAGVSPSYYARLEQGQSRHASTEVLDAIAEAYAAYGRLAASGHYVRFDLNEATRQLALELTDPSGIPLRSLSPRAVLELAAGAPLD